jgi:hypothetical protein
MIGQSALLAGLYAGVKGAEGMVRGALAARHASMASGTWSGLGYAGKALTLAKGAGLGAITGATEGMIKQTGELGKGFGMGDLVKPFVKAGEAVGSIPSWYYTNKAINDWKRHTGSLTEGFVLTAVDMADPNSVSLADTKRFMDNIRSMMSNNNFAGIADAVHKYANFPNYDKIGKEAKERLGSELGRFITSFDANDDARRALYAGLSYLQKEGGIDGILKTRPDLRDDILYAGHNEALPSLNRRYGINIYDGLHGMDVAEPDFGKFTQMYYVKHMLGTMMLNAESYLSNPSAIANVQVQPDLKVKIMDYVMQIEHVTERQAENVYYEMLKEITKIANSHNLSSDIAKKALQASFNDITSGKITEPYRSLHVYELSDKVTNNGKWLHPTFGGFT